MALPYEKDFDTILRDILTDYSNLDSAPDVSEGTMPFIMGSVLASMIWGLYRYQDYNSKQPFPDKADTVNLNHWGSIYDINRLDSDTDATYLNKILAFLRQPPAGGNAQDFEVWAKDQDNSVVTYLTVTYYNAYATIVDIAEGLGTVGVYTIPNDETIIDDVISSGSNTSVTANKLVDTTGSTDFVTDGVAVGDAVTNTDDSTIALVTNVDDLNTLSLDTDIFTAFPKAYLVEGAEELLRRATETYIELKRPLGMLSVTVESAKPQTQNVTINVSPPAGESLDTDAIQAAVENDLDSMAPGQTLYKATLTCIALAYGAENAVVTTPAADETSVDNDKFIRKGTVTINEV